MAQQFLQERRVKGFFSNDNGASWSTVNNGLTDTIINCIAVTGDNIYAGTAHGGIFLSADNGASWQQVITGLTTLTIQALAVHNNDVFAAGGAEYLLLRQRCFMAIPN